LPSTSSPRCSWFTRSAVWSSVITWSNPARASWPAYVSRGCNW
jgi:hypothetical protein